MKQENLFIFNSDWNRFLALLIATAVGGLALLYLTVYLVDPYDVFSFSPDLDRVPVSSKRRHFTPGIARSPDFDSFIIGSSTVMLLNPNHLNTLLDAKIANLSLPAASPYEQLRIAELFSDYHETTNLVIVSIDEVWCDIKGVGQYVDVGNDAIKEKRHIQEWMYSSHFWQQLPPLNKRIIKDTRKQLSHLLDLKNFSYQTNGYTDFTKNLAQKMTPTDIEIKLYGTSSIKFKLAQQPAVILSEAEIQNWLFPDIIQLEQWLTVLDPSTRKILLFPPYHHFRLAQIGSKDEIRWQECKKRVAKMSQTIPQVTVVDFMIHSSISNNDKNYWDSLHYTVDIADIIEQTLGQIMIKQDDKDTISTTNHVQPPFFHILSKPSTIQ